MWKSARNCRVCLFTRMPLTGFDRGSLNFFWGFLGQGSIRWTGQGSIRWTGAVPAFLNERVCSQDSCGVCCVSCFGEESGKNGAPVRSHKMNFVMGMGMKGVYRLYTL